MSLPKHMALTSSPSSASSAVCVRDAKKDKGSKVPWSPHEDAILRALVEKHGAQSWSIICKNISGRSAKSCRLRWCNHLLPGLNLKPFTPEEDSKIIELHHKYSSRWATIARHMPGRSDNAIKNRWNCTLEKRQRHELPMKRKRSDDGCRDDGFGSKVAESCRPSKPRPKTLHWEKIEPPEICKRDCESQKPLLELNLLAPYISHWEKQVFDTQQVFTGFKIDHGIDDPITTLTLRFPGTPTESYSGHSSSERQRKMQRVLID